jgi:hypothetical protein
MQPLPKTKNPLVVLTDFEHTQAWKRIKDLISAPVYVPGATFYAGVQFLKDGAFERLGPEDLLERVPMDYKHPFLLVVDNIALTQPEFPILVIDLLRERGRSFRAIPSAVQSIENNLSLSNMSFSEFADAVDEHGIFRGFLQS